MKTFAVFFSALVVFVSSLSAHPTGHEGGFLETAKHFVTHPDHLLMWGAVLFLGLWAGWKMYRSRKGARGSWEKL